MNDFKDMLSGLDEVHAEFDKVLKDLEKLSSTMPEPYKSKVRGQMAAMKTAAKNMDQKALSKIMQDLSNFAQDANRNNS